MDSLKQGGGIDPASAFLNYLWQNYISSGTFWGVVLVIFFFLWVLRVFIFDNKNIKWNTSSWFYPLCYFVICAFVVWLKADIHYQGFKQYLNDFITQISVTSFLYMVFGHKLIAWASNVAGIKFGLIDEKTLPPPEQKP